MIDFEKLAAPFPPERTSWRVGSTNRKSQQRQNGQNAKATKGLPLCYIDARDVMERLDDVCGPAGWQCKYSHATGKTVCDIGIYVGDGEWVWKADGAGDTDHEAEKGALSDAFKRAAVRWGIGRYLYGIKASWIDLDDREAIPTEAYAKLEDLLKVHTDEIEWGNSEDRATLRAMANAVRSMVKTADDVRRYREANKGSFQLLRVRAREHINQILDQIEEGAVNQAA